MYKGGGTAGQVGADGKLSVNDAAADILVSWDFAIGTTAVLVIFRESVFTMRLVRSLTKFIVPSHWPSNVASCRGLPSQTVKTTRSLRTYSRVLRMELETGSSHRTQLPDRR